MEQATGLVYLSDLSPKDKRWDVRRAEADDIKELYRGTKYDAYVARMRDCSAHLVFAFKVTEIGLVELKLELTKFCRVPLCPVCQGRRSLKWVAKTFKILPQIKADYPKSRFIFLTLTVKNCALDRLRETLTWMNKSWAKLIRYKDFPAQGWMRATEVTRSGDDTAHPHFHCLLMVPSGYFGANYLSQERWREMWRDALRVSYLPQVNVKAIKPSKDLPKALRDDPLAAAIVETVKYCVSPSDILRSNNFRKMTQQVKMSDQDWLVELTDQLYKMRRIATGGILKEYLKVLEDEQDSDHHDLIHINEDGETQADEESPRVGFDWNTEVRRYHVNQEVG